MCGIFGIVLGEGSTLTREDWQHVLTRLFLLSESRGKEAAGLALATTQRIVVHKDSVSAAEMLGARDFKTALERGINGFFDRREDEPVAIGSDTSDVGGKGRGSLAAIGHCRLVTNGLQGIDANNQPVCWNNAVVVHNGIVVNVDALWAKDTTIEPTAEVDTEVIAAFVEKYRAEMPLDQAVRRTFEDIYGETSIAMLYRDLNAMVLATNTGSLFVLRSPCGKALLFASEAYICKQLTQGPKALPGFRGQPWQQIKANEGLIVDLGDLSGVNFPLNGREPPEALATPNTSRNLGMQRTLEDKAKRFESYRKELKRCTKCLLPETMPSIFYDDKGVCNYCHDHKPYAHKPEAELAEIFDRNRSKDGSPDCVIAFSGGRDSSMGLHVLKTKYGMTPIAYTYDWGMVTDLARRNQARMCGRLGVEHIWVSANIKQKRANIRRNVRAWLKRPDLGLVPLFMAGDKQFFWHANRMMRDTNIPLMVLCANRYEKTDFKAGFLGISSRSATIHKPSSLSLPAKAALLARYGARFLSNPRYLNASLPDTIGAFVSYYVINQDYASLFDHVPWDEDEINRTLIGDYEWEIAKDTNTTWRIGDGTAPFYNYIYHTVAGFTESDTFRSNQIREGVITRSQGMDLVEVENRPRWDSIREYTQLINIDFDEAVRIIDRIPKLYVPRAEGGAGI
jgi:glutamine---fructose-6-phosphate transaminase (isomerizing)